MHNNDPSVFRWEEWDWRPLARLIAWLAMGSVWLAMRSALSAAAVERVIGEIALGWLLSFGLLTYLQILVATAVLRLALAADDFAYGAADRVVRALMPRASFAMSFLAAFALEVSTILAVCLAGTLL